jgi:hypothetical protein
MSSARAHPSPSPSGARRRRLVVGVIALTIAAGLVTAGLVAVTRRHHHTDPPGPTSVLPRQPLPAEVAARIAGVPQAVLDSVGAPAGVQAPSRAPAGTALTAGGKPLVLYIGAEYCPFCAAERWALALALSRFGTFTDLSATRSSSTDVDPGTPTLSFYGATYRSPYVAFTAVETATDQPDGKGGYRPLEAPTPAEVKLLDAYDPGGSIPFLDIANRWINVGAPYDPGALGRSVDAVAADLSQPGTAAARGVDGTANLLAAAICDVTGGRPAAVCASPAVTAGSRRLASR